MTSTTKSPVIAAPATAPEVKVVAKAAPAKAKSTTVTKAPVAKAPAAKKPVAKPAATKPAAKAAAPVAKKVAAATKPALPAKPKKIKMVRDSLTMPKPEYAVLDELKQRAAKLTVSVKKTEIIRAGIKALAAMNDVALLAAIRAVPSLKTGRPSKK